jgi:hypothetical protein
MSIYRHIPGSPLDQYVDFCWYYVDFSPDHDREHVLPDGTFELIVNLQEIPRKLFHGANSATYDAVCARLDFRRALQVPGYRRAAAVINDRCPF